MQIEPLETITRLGLSDCDVSPDGQAVAAPYQEDDGFRLGVWFTRACNWLADLLLPGPYHEPRFAPGGRRLAARQDGEEVTVWSLPEGRELFARYRQGGAQMAALAFGPEGETVAIAQGDRLGLFAVGDGSALGSLAMPAQVRALRSSADGRLLAVGLEAGGAVVADLEGPQVMAALPGIDQPVNTLSFHPQRPWLLAATTPSFAVVGGRPRRTGHGWAEVWNYETGQRIARVPCDYQAALLGQGEYLATLTNNSRSLWVWQIPQQELVAHIEEVVPELLIDDQGHETRRATLAASAAGDVLAVAGLSRPVSAAGVLRLYAFQMEAVPRAQ